MTINNISAKVAAALAISFLAVAPACAQSQNLVTNPSLSFNSASGGSNNALLLVSAGVLLIGLVDDNNTLTLLGGLGVLYSVVGSGQSHFQSYRHEVAKTGPLSVGFISYRQPDLSPMRPSPYIQATFKF